MYRKSMREALEEARAYRDTTKDTTEGGPPTDGGPGSGAHNHKKPRNLTKTAKGIAFSPKYRGGDYTGAYKAINKIKKGLADRPAVARALKRANEELEEKSKYLRYSDLLIQKGRMQRAGDKQGERLTDIEIEKEKKKLGITDEFIPEGMMKRLIGAVQDKLSKEGGAAGFADLAKAAKSMGVTLTKDMLKDMPGVKQHRDGDYILENKSSELINLYQIKNKTPEIEARIAKLEKELKVIKREETELEEAKTVGGAFAQGNLQRMSDKQFKEFYGMTKDEYIKKYGDPTKEELEEALEVKWDANKQGWFDKQGKRRYLGKFATSKLMSKAIDKAKTSGDFITPFELKHGQKPEQVEEKTELNEAININIVKGMTQRNDHFGARLYIAEQMRDKEMMTIYQGLGLAHDNYNRYVGNSALMVRQKLESALKVKIIGQYGREKGAEIIKAL